MSLLDSEILLLIVVILISGSIAGLLAGMFGVGGGVILVPTLIYTLDSLEYNYMLNTHIAIGTSLAIIIPTSISSAYSHYKKGSVDLEILKINEEFKKYF